MNGITTVFFIDDDEDDQEIFVTAIKKAAPTVVCYTYFNASEVLIRLVKGMVKPDVIFLDLNMPVMNGHQFLREIKKKEGLKNIPVYIFSTSSDPATIKLTVELGAKNFLTKPEKMDELVNRLKHILT